MELNDLVKMTQRVRNEGQDIDRGIPKAAFT